MSPTDPRHGSYAGASAHRRAGERPCPACLCAEARTRKQNRWLEHIGQPATIPALGTIRRLQALRRLGWTVVAIAAESGIPEKTLRNPTYRGTNVYRTTADAVAATYDRLSMRIPEGPYATRERRYAERQGWPPPLAWDDIDNPTEQPRGHVTAAGRTPIDEAVVQRVLAGERLPTTPAERDEITRRWVARGGSNKTLCTRMGWKQGRYGHENDEKEAS